MTKQYNCEHEYIFIGSIWKEVETDYEEEFPPMIPIAHKVMCPKCGKVKIHRTSKEEQEFN